MNALGGDEVGILRAVYCCLDVLTLVRIEPGRFTPVGPVPGWYRLIFSDAESAELQPGKHSLFLENFLSDAEKFWQASEAGPFLSGPWSEPDQSGKDVVLEAAAIHDASQSILLLQRPRLYESQQAIIQLARENSLKYDRLAKTEEALRRSEARINAILDMVPDWIFLLNKEAICIDLKQAKGYDGTADFRPFLGRRFHDLFPSHLEAEISVCMDRAQKTDAVQTMFLELISENRVARYECRFIARGEQQFLAILRLA